MSEKVGYSSLGRQLIAIAERIEDTTALDGAARTLTSLTTLVEAGPLPRLLRGAWLGHAVHPPATDFPLGSWMAASLLDLIGGERGKRPAERLIAFGLLMALPTAASGLSEWRQTTDGSRRVGVVHASINATATLLYGASLLARRRDRRVMGVGLGLLGGIVATIGGYFGGHLSLARRVGTGERT